MIFENVFDDNSNFQHSFYKPDFFPAEYMLCGHVILKIFKSIGRIVRNGGRKVDHQRPKNDKKLKVSNFTSEAIFGQLVLYMCLPAYKNDS